MNKKLMIGRLHLNMWEPSRESINLGKVSRMILNCGKVVDLYLHRYDSNYILVISDGDKTWRSWLKTTEDMMCRLKGTGFEQKVYQLIKKDRGKDE